MMSLSLLLFLLVTLFIPLTWGENPTTHNPCTSKTKCNECIRIPTCAWCLDLNYGEGPSCYQPSTTHNYCSEEFAWNPDNRQVHMEARRLGASSLPESLHKPEQISPQKVSLKLRVNQVHRLRFHYARAVHPYDHRGHHYKNLTSTVEMRDNAEGEVHITYHSSCLDGGPSREINKCSGLKVDQKVEFEARIEVTECPTNPFDWHQEIQIYPVGILDRLVIELEILCDCPCERPGNYEMQARECSSVGTFKCGVCECDVQYFGRRCECSSSHSGGTFSSCQPDNTSTAVCSGRGTCICGQCNCNRRTNPTEMVYGQYCECDDFSCDRSNQQLCSGRGTCQCGGCQCEPGWTGTACDCRTLDDMCIPPEGGPVCSGNGDCMCGACICHENVEGHYCQRNPRVPGHCLLLKDCVQCQMYQTGPLTKEECANNCTFLPIHVQSVQAYEQDEVLCVYLDEDQCHFLFVYSYKNGLVVRAQAKRECPPKIHRQFVQTARAIQTALSTIITWIKDTIGGFL